MLASPGVTICLMTFDNSLISWRVSNDSVFTRALGPLGFAAVDRKGIVQPKFSYRVLDGRLSPSLCTIPLLTEHTHPQSTKPPSNHPSTATIFKCNSTPRLVFVPSGPLCPTFHNYKLYLYIISNNCFHKTRKTLQSTFSNTRRVHCTAIIYSDLSYYFPMNRY